MNSIDIDQEKKSDDSSVSHDKSRKSDKEYEKSGESNEESYEAYRTKSLPEGYTPYKETGQAVELVYDRYDSDYEGEQPGQEPKSTSSNRKESCCTKGWLSNFKRRQLCIPGVPTRRRGSESQKGSRVVEIKIPSSC